MFNPFSWFSAKVVEDDVLLLIAKLRAGLEVIIADVKAVLDWIDKNAGTIVADLEAILALVTKLGGATNPELTAIVAAANTAVAALNAYADSRKKGSTKAAAVVDGYLAVSKARQLHAQIGQAIATAKYEPVKSATPTAPVVTAATLPIAALLDLADGPVDVKMIPGKAK